MTRDEISLRAKSEGGMFAVIPAVVLKDEELSWSAKMLYGIITWKCNEHAYCWITNRGLGNEMGLSPKRISVLLSMLEERGHIETEIFRDEETGQVLHRHIYPIMKSSRGILGAEEMEYPIPENMDTPIHENRDRYPHTEEYPIPENGEEKYKIKIKKENTIAHLKNLCGILSAIESAEDARTADMAVLSALEANGYVCQSGVPVPSRSNDPRYTGRVGIVAAKDGVTIAIETDRKNIRKKSLYKLLGYPCDLRILLLRGGEATEAPSGIDAVIPLKLKVNDDLFHVFWDSYPKKVDKRRAYEAFKRLKVTPELLSCMLAALDKQKQSEQWREANGRYIPHATTWLNGRRWEDTMPTTASGGSGPSARPQARQLTGWHTEVINGEEVMVQDG